MMNPMEHPLRISKKLIILFLVLAVVGFADAAYLTAEHVRGVIPPCSVLNGCEQVLTSAYATVRGIPTSAFGVFYYTLLIVLMVAFLDSRREKIFTATVWLTGGGLLASAYFVSIQAFVIKAFCPFCLLSAATSTLLFIIAFRMRKLRKIDY